MLIVHQMSVTTSCRSRGFENIDRHTNTGFREDFKVEIISGDALNVDQLGC